MSDLSESLRTLSKGGVVVFLGLLFDNAISFFAKVAIAQYLGPLNFGSVALGLTIVFTISQVGLLGVDRGVARYLPRYESDGERRGVVRSGLLVGGATVLVTSAATFLLAEFLAVEVFGDASLVLVFRLFAVVAPFAALLRFTIGTARGMSRTMPRVLLQNVIEPSTRTILIAVAVLTGAGVLGGTLAYGLPYVVAAMPAAWFLLRHSPLKNRTKPDPSTDMYGELLRFSAPLAVTGSMTFIFSNLDTYLLGVLENLGDVGVYQVVYPLATMLTLVLTAFGFLAMPVLSKHHAAEEYVEMRRLYRTLTKWILVGSLPAFLPMIFIPETVIAATFGAEYVRGATALTVLAFGFFSHLAAGPNTDALSTTGRSNLIMWNYIGAATLNVVLNLVLIPRFGLVGAALATTISYVALNLATNTELYYLYRIQPFSARGTGLAVVAPLVFVAVARLLLPASKNPLVALLLVMAVFTALYGVLAVVLGIEHEERVVIGEVEDRFGVNLSLLLRLSRVGP